MAKGVNAMVVFPDAGKAVLPAIRQAYKAGVVTVPYRVFPGGKAGTDYDYFISTDFKQAGVLWGNWVVKALHGKGNVVNLGGPPANSQSLDEYEGMQSGFKSHPGIKFIGQTPYNVTNWDPAQTQKVVTAVLAKYPKIDAITTDFGAALASSFAAFKQAGRQIPAIATEDANKLLPWEQMKGNPASSCSPSPRRTGCRAWRSTSRSPRPPAGKIPASTVVPQKAFEDSLTGKPNPVTCDKSMPADAFMSSPPDPPAAARRSGE